MSTPPRHVDERSWTGYTFPFDFRLNLETALRLHPHTGHVVLVGGADDTSGFFADLFRQGYAAWPDALPLIDLVGLPLPDLLQELQSLPTNSVAFALPLLVDGAGQRFVPQDQMRRLSELSTAPMYSFWDTMIGHGVVGGHISDSSAIGEHLANVSQLILSGEAPSPEQLSMALHFHADWRQLKRWNIPLSLLPSDSIIHYREKTLWQRYGWLITIATVVLGTLMTLNIILLALRRRLQRIIAERTTELQQTNVKLQTALQESELARNSTHAANTAKSRFLAIMSHELRTPMNGILGMAQLLISAPDSSAQSQEHGQIILSSGQTLLMLLNDILDLSKIEAGHLKLDSKPMQIDTVLQETVALYRDAAQQKGISLHAHTSETAQVTCRGDALRIKQMLNNLVSNAIKFTDRGEVSINVKRVERAASPDATNCTLEFSVRDTGPGISPENQNRLFQPFSQLGTSEAEQLGSTGLGLSIVRSLTETMNGTVGVESEVGRGTRFWFRIRLPLTDEDSHEPAPVAADPPVPDAEPLAGHALIVEDNKTNQVVLKTMLQRLGLTADIANHGQEALDRLQQPDAQFDIIFMDIKMPIMDGYDATRRIRQWERETDRDRHPIIALTADAFPEDRNRCLDAGMDDYLAKPIGPGALQEVLRKRLPRT
jgi:signal transduction histidine kinase/CheY-like chemotaxis protein